MPGYGLWQNAAIFPGLCDVHVIGKSLADWAAAAAALRKDLLAGVAMAVAARALGDGKLLLSSETRSTHERALASATPSPGLSPYAFGRKTDP
jgi:hypothetical protein